MLTCQELVEVVTDYVEGSLSDEDVQRFDEHLASCMGCATYVAQMRQTIELTGTLREEDLSPDARDALLARFHDWNRR
jgi:anti-sigma factor RsiW